MSDDSSNMSTQEQIPTLLTPADVYDHFGGKIGRGSIYALFRSGRIPSIQVGQRRYATATEVNEWLAREAKAA